MVRRERCTAQSMQRLFAEYYHNISSTDALLRWPVSGLNSDDD